jgi:transcription factor MYB, plant
MNVTVTTSGSGHKVKAAVKKTKVAPKNHDHSVATNTVASDDEDGIVDVKPIASVTSEAWNTSISKKSHSR